jgi:Bacterial protein of unknown function (DUF885)
MRHLDSLVDGLLAQHFTFRPVDATFMGIGGHDHRLPPADSDAPHREAAALADLLRNLEAIEPPQRGGPALDYSIAQSHLKHAARELAERPRYRDPCWYTSEAAFAIISLMLPACAAATSEMLAARLAGIPSFLGQARHHLRGESVCADWVLRARTEARAMIRLLGGGLRRHSLWRDSMAPLAEAAAASLGAFDVALADLPDADPRCGRDYLAFILRDVHQLPIGLDEAEAMAAERFARLNEELAAAAIQLDPQRSWTEQLAALEAERIQAPDLAQIYRRWHDHAMASAAALVTPASEYALAFETLPAWSQDVFGDTYFLAYRSPPPAMPGTGSIYWVTNQPQSLVGIKQTHAVHHASIGHHTHNARARVAPSRLARLAETGTARGVAFLAAGTTGEGWACYAQSLMAEADGFLSPVERELQLREIERRNVACLLADIRLHSRRWTLADMRRFYAEEAGFPKPRIWGETTRNSIFPGTRIMYWLGSEAIRQGRKRWAGGARDYHDAVLARGHATIAAVIEDVLRPAA